VVCGAPLTSQEVYTCKRALFDLRLKKAIRQDYKSSEFKVNKKKVGFVTITVRLSITIIEDVWNHNRKVGNVLRICQGRNTAQ
jgi:hypothetical protein